VEFLRRLGLRESCEVGWCVAHFKASKPERDISGYVLITVESFRRLTWLAIHGDEDARSL
jgi:hypothetical protein